MSGKPHVPRELIADKDITPKEAMHRKMLRTEMDDNSFREEVTEIAWGNMTDRQPFDDEETIDKLYEYSMKAYAFDEGLSNEDLQIIWKEAEGHGTIRKYINKDYYWVTEQNPHPHEDMIDEGNVTEEMNTAMEEALDEGNMDSWIGHTHYTQDEDGKDIEVEVSGVFNAELNEDLEFQDHPVKVRIFDVGADLDGKALPDDEERRLIEKHQKRLFRKVGERIDDIVVVETTFPEDGKVGGIEGSVEYERTEDFDAEDDKYPITRGVLWGGVFGLTLPWVIDQIKNRSNKEE